MLVPSSITTLTPILNAAAFATCITVLPAAIGPVNVLDICALKLSSQSKQPSNSTNSPLATSTPVLDDVKVLS